MQEYSARTAIVTGASRRIGIGAAIALALAEKGIHVFVTYWHDYDRGMPWGSDAREVMALQEQLKVLSGSSGSLEVDLSQPSSARSLLDEAENTLGPIDILINNAAMSIEQDLDSLSSEVLDLVYNVNARATMLLTAEFARRHSGVGTGRVVNLTSGQSIGAMPEELPYAVSKGAVEAFTKSACVSLGKKGITINAIDPGATDTGWMSDELRKDIVLQNPLGRVGMPKDVAHLVSFLVSDSGAWVNGQILRSRGGI